MKRTGLLPMLALVAFSGGLLYCALTGDAAGQEKGEETTMQVVSDGKEEAPPAGEPAKAEPAKAEATEAAAPEDEEEFGDEDQAGIKEGSSNESSFTVPGRLDGLFTYLTDIQVSDIPQDRVDPAEILYPNELGMNSFGGARLRLSPRLDYKDLFSLVIEGDLLLYPFGDEPVGADRSKDLRVLTSDTSNWRHWVSPRQLYFEFKLPIGVLRFGQMASSWGMGIMANDGARDPVFGNVFGGDLVERVLFATKPFSKLSGDLFKDFMIVVAGDLVFDDLTARLYEGDIAWQAVAALRWDYRKQAAGFYFVYRDQTKSDDRWLKVFAFDWYLKLATTFHADVEGYLEGEAAFIGGETTLAYSIQHPEGHDVRQFGGAARLGVKWLDYFHFRFEGGYASGDANLYDGAIRSFTMDPNNRIGLILFPEVLAWQSARAATIAASDEITGVDNPGIELIPTNGGVSGAWYLNPVIVSKPVKWLDLRVGLVIARTSSSLVSAWEQKNKGGPAGYLGGDVRKKNLGVELDGAVWFDLPVKYVGLSIGAEGGYFWPGDYFTDADGRRMKGVGTVSGRLRISF